MNTIFTRAARSAALALAAALPLAAAADDDARLPADQLVAAIQAAVTSRPGEVKEVEIERERDKTIVKVEVVGADGKEQDVKVDAATRQVIR